uniref:Uncharacterized protein n=1 Tax=Heterorhabditis bacteriophora TaxID=37862 RepID=A0A1I7X5W2_HETBA
MSIQQPQNVSLSSNGSKSSLHQPSSAREREKSFVGFFGAGMGSMGGGTVNRPGRAQDTSQVQVKKLSVHMYNYLHVNYFCRYLIISLYIAYEKLDKHGSGKIIIFEKYWRKAF